MSEKKYDLEGRLVEFAANIVFLCKNLPSALTGNYYGNQLLRSAGSSALNFEEAQGTKPQKDKIHKLTLSLMELKESRVNLRILNKVNYGESTLREPLLNEVEQLIKIIATIIRNNNSQI